MRSAFERRGRNLFWEVYIGGICWSQLSILGRDVRIAKLTDDRQFVSRTTHIERFGGASKRAESPMDSLGCRSGHSWKAESRGCRTELCWDVVVELDEEGERTAGGER
jgi:hypothetical protein